jgi:hypothetical protein
MLDFEWGRKRMRERTAESGCGVPPLGEWGEKSGEREVTERQVAVASGRRENEEGKGGSMDGASLLESSGEEKMRGGGRRR